VLDKWTWRDFIKREISFVAILSLVTAIGLLILATQIASVEGGYGRAAHSILDALNRRSFGDPTEYSGVFQDALRSDFISVFVTYLHFPTLTLSGLTISNPLLSSILHLETWVWIVLFFIASVVLVVRTGSPQNSAGYHIVLAEYPTPHRSKSLALIAATWYSILAPLSWLVIFKAHAYIHTRLAPVIWQLPFILFGIALIGYTISIFWGHGQARMYADN